MDEIVNELTEDQAWEKFMYDDPALFFLSKDDPEAFDEWVIENNIIIVQEVYTAIEKE